MEGDLPTAVLAQVCGTFQLGSATSVTYLPHGRVNDSFLVQTSIGTYVVRRSRFERTADAVASEHALIAHLSERGFPTPPLRTTADGRTFLVVGERIYRVTTFVPGEHCRADDPSHLRACARTLARYHRLVADYDPSPRAGFVPVLHELLAGLSTLPTTGKGGPSATSSPRPSDEAGVLGWPYPLQATLEATCARLAESEAPPTVVVHASCRRESFVFRDGRLVAMLDYDNAHADVRTLDLAIALLSFAMVRPAKTFLDVERAAAFVAAYSELTPIDPSELALIPWYLRARILKRELTRYRRYRSHPGPSREEKLHRAATLVRWLDEHERALRSTWSCAAEGSRV